MSFPCGDIKHCANSGCGYKCCDFGSKGHIIMMPNEYESEWANSLTHLKIIDDDYMGGKKVKCIAKNKVDCDKGYKPIQCRIFPLWVRGNAKIEQSERCPLSHNQTVSHEVVAKEIISDFFRYTLFDNDFFVKDMTEFLDKAEVCRYVIKDENNE